MYTCGKKDRHCVFTTFPNLPMTSWKLILWTPDAQLYISGAGEPKRYEHSKCLIHNILIMYFELSTLSKNIFKVKS